MIFPKGQTLYENLNTSFTQLEAMMGELKNVQFTGYVQLTGWEYEGILLMDTGTMVNALEEAKGQRKLGPGAADSIAAKSREKDGTLNVYRLSAEMTQLLANLFNSEPIYKDLSSDLTGLDKLTAKMQNEKLTGYIQIKMLKSQGAGTIYMRDGKVLDCLMTVKDTTSSGAQVLEQLVRVTASETSTFTVYRADLAAVYGDGMNLSDSFARQGMLTFWQDAIKTFETVTDGVSKAGTFIPVFKRACINHATEFPFLDPFAAEFEYKDGQIKFDGQATVAQFNEGLSTVLAQTTDDLSNQLDAKFMMSKLKPAVQAFAEKYNGRLEEVGLKAALPNLFGK